MRQSKKLKHKFFLALGSVLAAFLAIATATFAWYIYNTEKHTTNVRMAAGTGASLRISNSYDGTYGQSAILDEFSGTLNPVSTDRISGGFQKVYGFSNGSENQANLVASLFGEGDDMDFYQTSLFLQTNGSPMQVYLSDIGYEDSDADNPISTAIRVGIVAHEPGRDMPQADEYIFEINTGDNPEAQYNTITGEEGYVLDSTKTDGTTVPFTPYTSDNFCSYNKATGETTVGADSLALCTISGNNGNYGESVQLDIYIWLEGCDKDCTNNLGAKVLSNLALSFAAGL